jgi:hypothetical protein
MPRAKSRTSHAAASRKSRSSRSSSARPNRREENEALRRYLDFVRAVIGVSSRNGR